jgi:hypothetical protein
MGAMLPSAAASPGWHAHHPQAGLGERVADPGREEEAGLQTNTHHPTRVLAHDTGEDVGVTGALAAPEAFARHVHDVDAGESMQTCGVCSGLRRF